MVEQFANNASSPLSADINSSTTSIGVVSGTLFSATGNFRVVIESEILLVTARSGNTLTVLRGQEGTIAAAHTSGIAVTQIVTAGAIAQLKIDTRTTHSVTATQTAQYFINSSDEIIACSTSSVAFAVILPFSPITGETHTITDVGGFASTRPITINGNGKSVVTSSSTLATSDVININYGSNTYLYNGTFWSLL